MRTSRILALGAVAALGITAVGCSNDSSGSTDENALTISGVSNEKAALDVVIPMFEEEYPDIDVTVETSALDQYQPTIRTQLSSGTASDVVGVWPGNGNPAAMEVLVPGGFLADLSDIERTQEFPEGVASVSQVDGSTYVAPLSFAGIGPIYNVTSMEEAGFEIPHTWSDLIDFCHEARDETGHAAFGLGAGTNWNTQLLTYALTPELVYGPDPDFATEMAAGNRTFADSGWVDALDMYQEMVDEGCFVEDPLGVSYEATVTAIAQGDVFGATLVTSGLAAIRAEAPEGTELTMAALPASDDESKTLMPGAAGSAWAINAEAEHAENAELFIEFLLRPDVMQAHADANGSLPSIPGDGEIDPALEVLKQYQADDKTVPWMDQNWPNARVQAAHFEAVQNMLSGVATAEEGLAAMDDAYAQGE